MLKTVVWLNIFVETVLQVQKNSIYFIFVTFVTLEMSSVLFFSI